MNVFLPYAKLGRSFGINIIMRVLLRTSILFEPRSNVLYLSEAGTPVMMFKIPNEQMAKFTKITLVVYPYKLWYMLRKAIEVGC